MSEWWGWLLPSGLEPVLSRESASSLWVGTRIALDGHLLALHLGQQGWSGRRGRGIISSLWVDTSAGTDPCLGQSPPPALGEFHNTSGEPTGCQLLPGWRSVGFALWPAAPEQVRAGEKYKPGGREATGSSDSVGYRRAGAEELYLGLKQGHTRADLSGSDGRPHRWASHPCFVVPLAHPCLCSAPSPRSGFWLRD